MIKIKIFNCNLFKDTRLRIQQKRKIVIIGPSGAGKSTLLKTLSTSRSSIKIDEEKVHFSQLCLMTQENFLFPHWDLKDNLTQPQIILRGVEIAEANQRAVSWIRRLQIAERPVLHLSGGERQKACLARALMLNPRVLLMDEPTSALDQQSQRIIAQVINEQSMERYIFLSTHNLAFAKEIGDFFIFIDSGKIVEMGARILQFPRTELLRKFLKV